MKRQLLISVFSGMLAVFYLNQAAASEAILTDDCSGAAS